jgi:putative spermidine/putrescine transport system permease protein
MTPGGLQSRRPLLTAYLVLVLIFLLAPVLLVIPMSFSETRYLKFPPTGMTLAWYSEYFHSPTWLAATGRSLLVAGCSAVLATIAGTLASLTLVRKTGPARLITGASLGPQVVPVIILGLGIMLLFSRFHMHSSLVGIVMAHAVLSLPFVITNVVGALRQRGQTLSQAARVLGATPVQAFLNVTLPSIRPAVISSAIFAFFISFDELVVALFVMGRNETLPMRIWSTVRDDLTPVVAAVATLLIVATVAAVVLAEFLQRDASVPADAPASA